MTNPIIHLICGGIGAGKTSYGRTLADRLGGVLFSIDEWMLNLFGEDAPQPLDMSWLAPRIGRCEGQIWRLAERLAKIGVPTILDLGFQTAEQRGRYVSLAQASGLRVQMHHLDVPQDERWRRVEERNARQDGTYQFVISRPMFDFMEQRWQAPTKQEIDAARDGTDQIA